MNTIDVSHIIQPFRDAIDNANIRSAHMYAFKSKNIRNSTNPYISLNYDFFDVQMKKETVMHAFKNILSFFEYNFLSKDNIIFQKYSIDNSKKVIDFINLTNLNFSDISISNGTIKNLDADNYKIQYFLNSLAVNCEIASNESDYIYYKHSIIKLTTNDNKNIYIINKVSPIYKPKGFLFTFNTDDNNDLDNNFKPLEEKLFKLPFYPHIIIASNYCFLIEPNVESIFGFEKFNQKIRDEIVPQLSTDINFAGNSFDLINSYCSKGKNYNLFANFNADRYEKVKNNDPQTLDLLKNKIGIPLDSNNHINITDDSQAEKLMLYLCNQIFQGIENSNLYEAKNPRVINP